MDEDFTQSRELCNGFALQTNSTINPLECSSSFRMQTQISKSLDKKLPANVTWLGWVSFFTDFSSEMIFSLLPAFLTLSLGAGAQVLGIIEGISETTASFVKILSGKISDRFPKKRPFVLVGYSLSSIMRSMIGLAPNWLTVLGLRFGDRVGKGIRTAPRDSLIALSVDPKMRGQAYGFHRMMDHTGAVVGALMSALLIFIFPGRYRLIFLLSAIPALLACLTIFRVREEELKPEVPFLSKEKSATGNSLPTNIKIFLAILFVFNLGCATDAFLLLRLQNNGVALALIPLMWAAFHIVKAVSNSYLGKLSDRFNHKVFVVLGWLLYSISYMIFSKELSTPVLMIFFLIYGMFYGFVEAPEKALVAAWSKKESYGNAFGAYHFIVGISLLPANLLFGFIWKTGNASMAFGFSALITLISTIALTVWMRWAPDGAES